MLLQTNLAGARARVDEYGRQTIFQIPRSYEYAKENFGRAARAVKVAFFAN